MKEAVPHALCKGVNLFVIHTPFHLVQLERMINNELIDKKLSSIVFYSDFVDPVGIQELFKYNSCQIILLPKNTFSLKQLFRNVFIESYRLNRLIQLYYRIIKKVFIYSNFTYVNLFSGTDKNIFDQTLFFFIDKYCTTVKINIIDEGIGLYVIKNKYDRWVNFLISKFTRIVFGVPLISITKLGSHPRSQIIYARYPELIHKEKFKQYYNIQVESNIRPKYGDYLLIIGRPIGHTLDEKEYYLFLKCIFDVISSTESINKFSRVLKPHPRENINIYKNFGINETLPKTSIEVIGEIPIGIIICFDSSSLLEIIGSGVDPMRVVNIKFQKRSIISELFNMDDIYYDRNLFKFQKSLEIRFAQFLQMYG